MYPCASSPAPLPTLSIPPPHQKQTGSESLQNKSQPSTEAHVLYFQAHNMFLAVSDSSSSNSLYALEL